MTYREIVKEALELLERDERPEVESWKERAEDELLYFPVSCVCRADLEGQGYNTQDLEDSEMEHVCVDACDHRSLRSQRWHSGQTQVFRNHRIAVRHTSNQPICSKWDRDHRKPLLEIS